MKKEFMIMMTVAVLTGCGGNGSNHGDRSRDSIQNHGPVPAIPGPAPVIHPGAVSTMGKVVAARFADLSFETALPIERVLVRNGQQVHRGQVLAVLDQYKLRNAIEQQQLAIQQAQLQIEQARLQMQDVIISQGYDPDKAASIPDDVRHHADVKSGYALSKSQLATARTALDAARHELRSGVLTAPFDGVVANLSMQAHQLAQPGQTVCRIIATGDMEVEFRVMEADLCHYKTGTSVNVIPVADKTSRHPATVIAINPFVDEQGAVTLRAKLSEAQGLFDGMNVEVILLNIDH